MSDRLQKNPAWTPAPPSRPGFRSVVALANGLLALGGLGVLLWLSRINYLLYHSLIEGLAVVVSATVFTVGWGSREVAGSAMLLVLAAGHAVVGGIDGLHLLAFKGMGVFPDSGPNLPTQLWVAARYVDALALLHAAASVGRAKPARPGLLVAAYAALGAVLVVAIGVGWFPACFVPGRGLTTFKVASEYAVCLVLGAVGYLFWQGRSRLDPSVLRLLVASTGVTILAELSFTLYADVYGFFNFLGHAFKLVAFGLVYRALVLSSLQTPYRLLFRDLALEQGRLRALFDNALVGIDHVDETGTLVMANPAAAAIWDRPAPIGARGDALLELGLRRPDGTPLSAREIPIVRSALEGVALRDVELTVVRPDGTRRDVLTNTAPILGPGGSVAGAMGVFLDVTERAKLAAELRTARDAAEAANRAKSDFLAAMSHEIRTPMNGVIGMTELALMEDLPPKAREYLGFGRESARSLLRIIDDILDLAKIEAGRTELREEAFDLRADFAALLSTLRSLASKKGLTLRHSVAPQAPRLVRGDRGRVGQVLANLTGNAIKFTESGEVVVSIRVSDEDRSQDATGRIRLLFEVRDTGAGISADKLETIFDAFTQLEGAGRAAGGGTGLGLAISRELVGLMGGRLWVESEPGRGSAFRFTAEFGTAEALEEKAQPQTASRAQRPTVAPLRVLLAEDNAVNQLFGRELLARDGHSVVVAGDGQEALEALASEPFDVVLMDVQMPEMDGLEATRRIRAGAVPGVARDLPIIALTAHALRGDRERFLAAGMDDCISKPIDVEAVYRVLAEVSARKASPHGASHGGCREG